MPKLSDLKVNMSVTTTFSKDNIYRDALHVALAERAELEHRLEMTEAALEEYKAHPMIGVSYALGEPDPEAQRKIADIIDEWRGVPPGGTSPVTGRVRTGDAEVDNLTGIPRYARKVLERLARELAIEREGMAAAREEIAVLRARNEDLTRTMHDVAASKDQEIAYMIEKHNEIRDELNNARVALDVANRTLATATNDLNAAQGEVEQLRAERRERESLELATTLDEMVKADTPTVRVYTGAAVESAYERGFEEGRAAAIDEADRIAHALTPGARSVMRERAIQRAKYTHAHDARHPGDEWLGLMEDATKRHGVRDWPRVFRVIGALAIAALDVLTAEGNDWLLKKDMEIIAATVHASADGSCPPPATDHVAQDGSSDHPYTVPRETLAHQAPPAVPMTVAADDIPTT